MSGLLVDDEHGLTEGLIAVTSDEALRARLQAGASDHATRFTWEATATRILSALADEARRWRSRPWRRRTH